MEESWIRQAEETAARGCIRLRIWTNVSDVVFREYPRRLLLFLDGLGDSNLFYKTLIIGVVMKRALNAVC